MKFQSIFILILLCVSLSAQDMRFYCDAMINADAPEHRVLSAEKFDKLLSEDLGADQSFDKSYADLKWISILYPTDSTFRTISWQIDKGEGKYQYFAYLQTKDGKLYKNDNIWGDDGLDEGQSIDWNKWSGGLVYNIINTKDTYTLFTFRYIDEFTKVKTCETLSFGPNEVLLGKQPLYETGEGTNQFKSRLTLQFSADSNGTLNYDATSQRIVYDNLITVMGRMPGQGTTLVADGSYKGFEFINNQWQAIDKLFNQISEQAPRRAQPKDGRDLFGRPGG
jgi:hypothetical protein